MRLLRRYIIKELLSPFIFSLLVIIFILFVQFLLRAIDRFLGKGIDSFTILEYLFLNLAWIVALAVPMAVLIATLMTFGRLSEDNEITAMRAAGISFLKIIRPALLFGTIICLLLLYFNNFILPEMNFRARILSGDIYRKRPVMSIDPGHFIGDLPDYGMIIGGKTGDIMKDVRIFSKNSRDKQTSIYSKTGELETIGNELILTLYNGEIHELDIKDFGEYRRIQFSKHKINIPVDDLMLMRRDTSNRTDREMTIPMMFERKNSYQDRINSVWKRMGNNYFKTLGDSVVPKTLKKTLSDLSEYQLDVEQDTSLSQIQVNTKTRKLKTLERQMTNEFNLLNSYQKSINKYGVEIHKKFSLPVACILFVLLGAPLGVLARKGGFVVGISLSFGFFLIYYLLLIGGEEMADRNIVSPAIGMWAPNVALFFIALYLTVRTVRERTPLRIKWPSFLNRKK
ncbi:LptF/LptG family permease [bacterium]|nr:LptF/LptG family permease [bacterium]